MTAECQWEILDSVHLAARSSFVCLRARARSSALRPDRYHLPDTEKNVFIINMSVPLWMIVYPLSSKRQENFNMSRKNAPELRRHVAVIGKMRSLCTHVNRNFVSRCPCCDNMITWHRTHCCNGCAMGSNHCHNCDRVKYCEVLNSCEFMRNRIDRIPGKIGCNLSHQCLWLTCLQSADVDWVLLNEDDVFITTKFCARRLWSVVEAAKRFGAHYVRMEASRNSAIATQHHRRHFVERVAGGTLYRMLAHAGMASYLIDRIGLRLLLSLCPFDCPQDMLWHSAKQLRPLYFHNDMVEMQGCHNSRDSSAPLGSVIMSIEAHRSTYESAI